MPFSRCEVSHHRATPHVPHTREAARLVPLVYDRLRALARRYMRDERAEHTLQPTALVHEAYLRLQGLDRVSWRGKTHFYAMAARQMRRVLVEHARATRAQKRGAERRRISLREDLALTRDHSLELLALDEALRGLTARSARQGRVAELRLFAGMRHEEIAQALGVSERTVLKDWRMARAWLSRELKGARGSLS
jgi:RNA polymerase sigma factor (TIGR02999 family)